MRIALESLPPITGVDRAGVSGREEIPAAEKAEDIRAVVQTERAESRGAAGARAVNFADDDDRLPQAFH